MTGLRFGYGTNGFASHRLDDALAVIADLGYAGVALTLDHAHLDPFAPGVADETRRVANRLSELGLAVVVETGARYLLDPVRKHQPTLLHDEPAPRVDFLRRASAIAADLGAECVSFWSGVLPSGVDADTGWRRLRDGVATVLDGVTGTGVRLALEPEPGHLVQHVAQALRLRDELGTPEQLGITLDVGHCVAVEPVTAAECVHAAGEALFNVQLDDMRPGVHEHLEFGEGRLDLAGTLGALTELGYQGLAAVELPRHSHAAPEVARRSLAALNHALSSATWLADAERTVRADPAKIRTLFPMAGRKAGRSPLDADGLVHGTTDDRARVRLLAALAEALEPAELAAEVAALYRHGDGAERRGVLRGLHLLPDSETEIVDTGTQLVDDALRANDIGLVAAALGPFAATHLDAHAWRHGVLKCLFVGVPVAAVAGLAERADDVLARMVGDYVAERQAAGREVPADAYLVLQEAGQ